MSKSTTGNSIVLREGWCSNSLAIFSLTHGEGILPCYIHTAYTTPENRVLFSKCGQDNAKHITICQEKEGGEEMGR